MTERAELMTRMEELLGPRRDEAQTAVAELLAGVEDGACVQNLHLQLTEALYRVSRLIEVRAARSALAASGEVPGDVAEVSS
ncbi:hypothetical protein [Brevibacterium gallinarum]|uniref:Uncharacterized protein n=1 Tax=Brevibacterium gallinarum TaxID=2762220 RepID=A0ABR8WQI8_9MICO|nr:hypothetical protein [Brevibacterium gallinarum]MBD8019354.1 hypothetical protein [Brevibacterium gallinarum]